MKKILGISAAAMTLACLVSCASTPKAAAPSASAGPIQPTGPLNTSTKTGMDAIPAAELEKAGDVDTASVTFASADLSGWNLNKNKNYIKDEAGNCFINVQYEGEKWDKDITKDKAELITVGSDKVAAFNLGLNKSSDQYGILFNISKQGQKPVDMTTSTMKIRIYIPEELTQPNAEGFVPTLKFAARDPSWTQWFFGGECGKSFTFCDIGAGWHTITIDFQNKVIDLGSRKGTFTVSSAALKSCNMIDLYIQGKAIASNLDVPILIDWVDISKNPEK